MHLITFCTLLAHSVVHGAMAGYTGFTIGQVNGRHCYIPFYVSHRIFTIRTGSYLYRIQRHKLRLKPSTPFCFNALCTDCLHHSLQRITEKQNRVSITDRMWARLLSSTNQPSFLCNKVIEEAKKEQERTAQLIDGPPSHRKLDGKVAGPNSGDAK